MGNWTSNTVGEEDPETREHNAANEVEEISGTGVIQPLYDPAGNMIFGPTPGLPATGQHYVYDAWNRLVAVRAG